MKSACACAGDTPELCIKPAMGSWGLHQPLPCIADGTDLMLYGLALQDRWPSLPANALSIPHPEIELPPVSNQQLMVEPYIHAARSATPPTPTPYAPCKNPHLTPYAICLHVFCDCCLHGQWPSWGCWWQRALPSACWQLCYFPSQWRPWTPASCIFTPVLDAALAVSGVQLWVQLLLVR